MQSVTNVHELLPLTPQVFHILVALADRDQHGYSIMQDVAERTGGRLTPFGRKVVKAEAARLSEMVEQARVYGLAPKRS
jgi:hypothetical protein